MSFTEKRLCNPTQLTTSGQILYTVPASKTSIIKQIVVTNVTESAATFSLYIGSAATPNALFNATSVAANDTIIINLSQVLNQLETLTALASTNLALNITISGVENDGPLNPLSTYIADQAITTAKLADASVTTAKIAVGAVVNEDIANNAVTQSKLASNLSGVTVTTSSLRATVVPTPFEGQAIFETDTDRMLIWNGTVWVGTEKLDSVQVNSSGHLNAFSQPIISGQIGSFTNPAADSLLQFDEFWVSRGITYNSSTRRFTVPTTGIYQITLNPFFNTGAAASRVLVGVNTDSPTASAHRGQAYRESATYDTGSINSVTSLNAGDYVVFRLQQGGLYNQSNDRFNQFSIRLVA
jgi:hypothetical protein